MLGVLIAFKVTPTMTRGHLLSAAMTMVDIFVGVWLEERDLTRTIDPASGDYQRGVGKFVTRFGSGSAGRSVAVRPAG